MQSRVAGLRALVAAESEQSEQRVRSVAATLDVELDKRMQAALQGYVEAGKLTSAEARAGAAERERDRLRGLADALQDEVACLKGQVGELGDAAELTTSAVAGLEMEGGLGGLSRELVRSKLAEAEAVKKMRASARSEVELRSKILQRDQRIAELKDALVVKTKAYEDARRRLLDTVASTQPATAGSGRAGSAPRARGGGGAQVTSGSGASGGGGGAGSRLMAPTASSRAHQGAAGAPRSPRDTDTDTRAGSRADQGRTRGGDARARTRSLSPPQARDDYADYHGASAENCGGGDRLSSRLAAASSSVEVERLRAALAEANAGAGIPGMRAQLAQAGGELASALAVANALVRKLHAEQHAVAVAAAASAAGSSPGAGTPGRMQLQHRPEPSMGMDPSSLPAQLSATMAELTTLVTELFTARRLARLHAGPSLVHLSSGAQVHGAVHDDALKSLHLQLAAVSRQRDILQQQLDKAPQLQSSGATPGPPARVGAPPGVVRLAELLAGGFKALDAAATRLEAAVQQQLSLGVVLSPELRGSAAAVVSEAMAADATVGLLCNELGRPIQWAPAAAGDTGELSLAASPSARAGGAIGAGGAAAAAATAQCARAGAASRLHAPLPFSFTPGGGGDGMDGCTPAPSGRGGGGGGSPGASSWHTATPAAAAHGAQYDAEARQAEAQAAAAAARDIQNQLCEARSTCALLTEKLVEAARRADKWKARASALSGQLSQTQSTSAIKDAAAAERQGEVERQLEERAARAQAEVLRLQAALAGSQAARRQLECSQAASNAAAGGTDTEVRSLSARLAEAQARATTLGMQVETERAAAQAASDSGREELVGLRASLAQEQAERARLLAQMRDLLAGGGGGGGARAAAAATATALHAGHQPGPALAYANAAAAAELDKLRSEVLKCHEAAAGAGAARERAEAAASGWKETARTLRERLGSAQRSHAGALASLGARVEAAERRAAQGAETLAARLEQLGARLAGLAASASASSPGVLLETQLRHLEGEAQRLATGLEHERAARTEDTQKTKWGALAKVGTYQAALKQMTADTEKAAAAAAREKAEVQVAAADAARRAADAEAALGDAERRLADARVRADEERSRTALASAKQLAEFQRRLDHERAAMAAESDARAEAAATQREAQGAAHAAAAAAALEGRYVQAIAEIEGERAALQSALEAIQRQFRQYQGLKAQELQALEERIVGLITGGAAEPKLVSDAAAAIRASIATLAPPPGGLGGGGGGWGGPPRARKAGPGVRFGTAPRVTAPGGGCAQGCGGGGAGCAVRRRVASTSSAAAALRTRAYCSGWGGAGAQQQRHALDAFEGAGLDGDGGAAAAEVAAATGADTAAATRRELLFERLQRQRAEALLQAARRSLATVKTRLRLMSKNVEMLRAASVAKEDAAKLAADLKDVREALKRAQAESARRGRALQLLQGLPGMGVHAGGMGIGDAGGLVLGPGAAASSASFASASAAAAAELDFASVAGAASVAARDATRDAEAHKLVASAAEAKLRDARKELERKNALVRELQRRVTELEAALAAASVPSTEAAAVLAAAEAKAKSLSGDCKRREATIRELRERLEVAQVARAEADELRAPLEDDIERSARAATRLRAELAKRDAALKAAQVESREAGEAAASERARGDTAAAGTAATHARAKEASRATRVLAAGMGRALVAAASARAAAAAAVTSGEGGGASSSGARGGGGGFFADEIAAMTDLSLVEIQALIGGGGGGAGGPATAFEQRLEPLIAAIEARVLSSAPAVAGGGECSPEAVGAAAVEPVRTLVGEVQREVDAALAALNSAGAQ
ncbi:hypothetical protein FOA52_005751 [Chlamydomonas sp. UWO 241]|nr:hypothetical protein FOA52_005751 [Chlamydomonas sp. UWO 241]